MTQTEHVTVDDNGWTTWALNGLPEVKARVDVTGPRIIVTAIMVTNTPVSGNDLRNIPLRRIESVLNEPQRSVYIRAAVNGGVTRRHFEIGSDDLSLELDGVEAKRRPDEFYAQVATVWETVRASGHKNPAQLIGDANSVSPGVVHRWVREARHRGVMAPSGQSPRRRRWYRAPEVAS